jgi:hypothetical protein
MLEQIRDLAQSLGIRDGGLVKLARDIAQDANLRDLEYMRAADRQELLLFLEAAMAAEGKLAIA